MRRAEARVMFFMGIWSGKDEQSEVNGPFPFRQGDQRVVFSMKNAVG